MAFNKSTALINYYARLMRKNCGIKVPAPIYDDVMKAVEKMREEEESEKTESEE